jgi:hypothetical protein
MCFSASASFGAGVILTGIGAVSLKKIQGPSQIPFASIPLLFAVQQISEGILWLALRNDGSESLEKFCTYTFLFFAQVLWPSWVPFAMFKLEPPGKRKIILKILLGIGLLVSLFLGYCLLSYPVEARISERHITYLQDYPIEHKPYLGILYILVTIAPSFISGIRWMSALGIAILISYIISQILYTNYVISVWCFFASVISITVLVILYQLNKTPAIKA